MRKVDIVLTNTEKETKAIEFTQHEEFILIHLTRFDTKATMYYLFTNTKGELVKNPFYAQEFIRLNKSQYDKLTFGKGLVHGEEIHGIVYIGTWIEILLFDINQNLENLFLHAEDTENLYFTIGDKKSTHLSVTDASDGIYRLKRVLLTSPAASYARTDIAAKNSYLAKLIELIHEKIKSNVEIDGFKEMQSRDKRKATNTHNFLLHY